MNETNFRKKDYAFCSGNYKMTNNGLIKSLHVLKYSSVIGMCVIRMVSRQETIFVYSDPISGSNELFRS